ncbi:hypothetical protein QAD02_010415 [Eretmocerus hayati]|uniref:Uncharacterized protein n=1 Tax=Eretmocerus hayati TaxID=131215 RepID=A0ACC2NWF5_9HYME|nr:hypothetical protein QAD02_010415 [Eretmocerus hayati]
MQIPRLGKVEAPSSDTPQSRARKFSWNSLNVAHNSGPCQNVDCAAIGPAILWPPQLRPSRAQESASAKMKTNKGQTLRPDQQRFTPYLRLAPGDDSHTPNLPYPIDYPDRGATPSLSGALDAVVAHLNSTSAGESTEMVNFWNQAAL